jgi:predicted GNAT family acetyltransferase
MIRKLTKHDHEQVFSYLQQEPSFNLFLIGDIEAYGYEQPFQELWGDFTEDDLLRGVLLRYHDSFIPYTKETMDVEGFSEMMRKQKDVKLSGKTSIAEQFEGKLPLGERRDMYFCECLNGKLALTPTQHIEVKLATLSDVDRIIALRTQILEFQTTAQAREILKQQIETNTGRTFYIEDKGEIVACASTAAENSLSAMIVGVCTHKKSRKKGYASYILSEIIHSITAEGKTLCLFYDNPEAGRIYKRLGFQDIGTWTMYR